MAAMSLRARTDAPAQRAAPEARPKFALNLVRKSDTIADVLDQPEDEWPGAVVATMDGLAERNRALMVLDRRVTCRSGIRMSHQFLWSAVHERRTQPGREPV